ncbi:hypothetical protein, partial [Aeromonas veronii]|uniref:hypothetical protein n=1 Tax=Aeromonas veronii TaxID=654 RepID=UPI001A7EA614
PQTARLSCQNMHDKPYRIAKHSKISRMMFSDGNFWDSGLHPQYATEDNTEEAAKWAYEDALAEASAWLASR